ncbi:MAG: hypothetical protein HN725_10180 [Alphaproteobacteria bacterium]|jgi:hypothetical protein|nr:hypothetical protein [Alphaproteobacteria bacterium]MBT4082987.1 hypothetical protein [Alphaproteobacteria bacterium]MBT4543458.1 hypothetical protein [Alphaproteobacteria bacterium]MBT7745648.1 hypothetical protein [Alphaproteobacteria bacterium]
MADNKNAPPAEKASSFELVPTAVDEQTHAELCLLYKESTDTVRFAKHLQWWTLGSTLMSFGAIVMLGKYVGTDMTYANQLTGAVILVTMGVIFTLIVYQFWQHNELRKIREISLHMSNLFGRIRRMKSRREANIQRYLLLIFMISTVILGAVIAYLGLQQVVYGR